MCEKIRSNLLSKIYVIEINSGYRTAFFSVSDSFVIPWLNSSLPHKKDDRNMRDFTSESNCKIAQSGREEY